mgnify:CR=1 FL=1
MSNIDKIIEKVLVSESNELDKVKAAAKVFSAAVEAVSNQKYKLNNALVEHFHSLKSNDPKRIRNSEARQDITYFVEKLKKANEDLLGRIEELSK